MLAGRNTAGGLRSGASGKMVVEVEDWHHGHSIKEENFSSFDAVPLCIKIVSYGTPCKNLWANRTFLKVVGTSLKDFRAQVPILCQLRSGGSKGHGLALAWLRKSAAAVRAGSKRELHVVHRV